MTISLTYKNATFDFSALLPTFFGDFLAAFGLGVTTAIYKTKKTFNNIALLVDN